MFDNLLNKLNPADLKNQISALLSQHLTPENVDQILAKLNLSDKVSPEQIEEAISKIQEMVNNKL